MSNTSAHVSQGLSSSSDFCIFCFYMGVCMLIRSDTFRMVVNRVRMLYVVDTDPLI